jgi:uncharacterized membrane protein
LINVFVPTTPNPTSGFLLLVPVKDIKVLDMSVGDGMKMLISGGAVTPISSKTKRKDTGRRRPGRKRKTKPESSKPYRSGGDV